MARLSQQVPRQATPYESRRVRGTSAGIPMHHLKAKLFLVATLAAPGTSLLAGCFKPEIPAAITCAADGACPPGLRCETSSNICVDPSQARVSELYFSQQPTSVEAGVVAPQIVVELRDGSGRTVPVTGGTFAVELE